MKPIGVGTFRTTDETRRLINVALDSNRISYGPLCREFESEMSRLHGNKYGILSNSGTSSLQVALQAMKEIHGWEDGAMVAVPASTFVATVNIVLHNKLTPVLVDIDKSYYSISHRGIDFLDRLLGIDVNYDCVAIIPVYPFGQPSDVTIKDYCWRPKIIADSCECLFANAKGKPLGHWADITCFSFYVAHLITTGIGGMSITNDERYAIKMRSLVNHGRNNIYISMDDNDPSRMREIIQNRFEFESIGHSFRITELEAALGLAQLKYRDRMLANRYAYATTLRNRLDNLSDGRLEFLRDRDGISNSWMMFPVVVNTDRFTKSDLTYFLESRGIETRDALPIIFQPCYKGRWDPYNYPVAKNLYDNGFYIGCHQDLTQNDMDYTIDTFKEFLDAR